jgi:hypothetical protein
VSSVIGSLIIAGRGGVSVRCNMLRNLLIVLACSSALALKSSSQPALQPASMQKRLHTLLHRPSRSALADVLHGPYPPDAFPAYLRAVPVLIVVGMMTTFFWSLFSRLVLAFKDLTTRCSLNVEFDFCRFLVPRRERLEL